MRVFAVVVAALVLAAPALASTPPSAAELETLLVCLECHETARRVELAVCERDEGDVARRIAAWQDEEQILDAMVAQFGAEVLSTPQTHGFDLIAWLLPLGGIALGAAAIAGGRLALVAAATRAATDGPPALDRGRGTPRRRRSSPGSMIEKLPIAFAAGLISVVTPCVLPLIPGYLSAISAVEIDRLGERGVGAEDRRSRACRSSSASRSSSSCSAPAPRPSGARSTSRPSSRSPASC